MLQVLKCELGIRLTASLKIFGSMFVTESILSNVSNHTTFSSLLCNWHEYILEWKQKQTSALDYVMYINPHVSWQFMNG